MRGQQESEHNLPYQLRNTVTAQLATAAAQRDRVTRHSHTLSPCDRSGSFALSLAASCLQNICQIICGSILSEVLETSRRLKHLNISRVVRHVMPNSDAFCHVWRISFPTATDFP